MNLSVDSFTNTTAGSSGYYFWRSGEESSHNSGWIQTNSWQDTDFGCNTHYTWYVKYRNGDGTETSTISVTSQDHPYTCPRPPSRRRLQPPTEEKPIEEMTKEELRAKILEIQKKIIMLLQQLIQLIQERIAQLQA